ncbi:MAG: hypothetical protein HZB23_08870 [Deltaproteobacteria bacterium]|nr:hypothetical protein [Deltaproteobacteria bacterium]
MGGVSDFLFGSSGSPRQTGTADLLTGSQKDLFEKLLAFAGNSVGTGLSPYGGELSAGASPLESQSFDAIDTMLSGGGILGQGRDALSGLLSDFDPTEASSTWRATVGDPMMDAWQDEILPKIKEEFIALGAGSSGAANRAIAGSGEDLAESMGSNLARFLFDAGEAHKNRQATAADEALSYAATPVQLGLSAGAAQRGIGQDALSADYQEWLRTRAENNPALALAMNLLGVRSFQPIIDEGKETESASALKELASIFNVFKLAK